MDRSPRWLDGGRLRLVRRAFASDDEVVAPRDEEVLSRVELGSERQAAWLRLAAVLLTGAALAVALPHTGVDRVAATALALNACVSVAGVLLVRKGTLRPWVPWVLGLSDVPLFLGYASAFGRFSTTLPAQFRLAHVEVWLIFLALSLSAVRGRPWLLLTQTALFSAGLTVVLTCSPSEDVAGPELSRELSVIFGVGQNIVRVLTILFSGLVLAAAAHRARANLRRATAASRKVDALSQFMAPPVASVIVDAELEELRVGRQQDAAVLFADVRGFSALSETLAPRDVAAFLTEFRRRAAFAIEREGGVVDKFVGDDVMGLFGVPIPRPDASVGAIRAGQRLLASVGAWSDERRRAGLASVRIGVGVHQGPVFVGAVGDRRLEFTVLGDTVNVARRMEELTKSLGYDLLVTSAAHRIAGGTTTSWVELPEQAVRGYQRPVRVLGYLPSRRCLRGSGCAPVEGEGARIE